MLHCSSLQSCHGALWEDEEDRGGGGGGGGGGDSVSDFSREDGALAASCFALHGGESSSCPVKRVGGQPACS